ncbi:RNA-binding S4 domain-containing protein, partial [Streptomyces sp. XM4011]|uniref:RNA-binding S4 domain-containing protein n=1 Tax=Streptomyces sp. XM4011 TaxID=2929780 RepID=UPI001FFB5EF7
MEKQGTQEAAGTVRVDVWIWSVRLAKTRSTAAAACKAGHVRINGDRAKPAQPVKPGDEVRIRQEGRERIVKVRVDVWIWSVRLAKTRSTAAAACKAGHVRINGD